MTDERVSEVENIDYVVCKICGCRKKVLLPHLKAKHNLTKEEYIKEYNSPTVCEETSKIFSKTMTATNKKYPDQASEACKRGQKLWKLRDPEGYREQRIKSGRKVLTSYHREWRENRPQEYRKNQQKNGKIGLTMILALHPDLYERGLGRWIRENPEEAKEAFSEGGKVGGAISGEKHIEFLLQWRKENPIASSIASVKGGKAGGIKAIVTLRKNKPYIYSNVHWDSKSEMLVAELLNDKFGFIPVEGVNCHVRINNIEIDFYLEDKNLFIEYHPGFMDDRTVEEYTCDRKNEIDNSSFEGTELVVIEKINDFEKRMMRYE